MVAPSVLAQVDGGDQYLDGIGETALVARYRFKGSAADHSRNAYHGTLRGTGSSYVADPKFGEVLSLPGTGDAYVQIPGVALEGLDAITVTGCIGVR
ncbi:MAG: hypothetical protein IT580_10765 [Verrucomicrobiales bacterium]|nr:hypothetical protein [Verrucomicrobiales bacterium]